MFSSMPGVAIIRRMSTKPPSKTSWPDPLSQRLKKLRHRMGEHSLDGLLITHGPDVRYLSDFGCQHSGDGWLLVTARQVHLISDFRFNEQIDRVCPFVKKVIRSGAITQAAAALSLELKLKKIGFQAESLTFQLHQLLNEKLPGKTLEPTRDWLIEQRAVKDETELRHIRRAISVMEQAYTQTLDQIRPGMSESEIVALLEYNMRWIGADGPSFETIVAIGANGSLPHHEPGRTRVKANTPILIDFGAKAEGYCGDLTRVVTLGGFHKKIAEIYRIVQEAQQAAIDAIAPGKAMKEIDAVARKIIEDAGYGDKFGHGLGHGIGLEIHELPTLNARSESVLMPGHVVTVEPGIYLPGMGGIRLEDDVLVTETGCVKLSGLPIGLESAII